MTKSDTTASGLGSMQRKYLLRARLTVLEPKLADQRAICKRLVELGYLHEAEEFPGVFEITPLGEELLNAR